MDSEAQDDELVVLSSIFEDYFREAASSRCKGGELVINLDLPETITLITNNGKITISAFLISSLLFTHF